MKGDRICPTCGQVIPFGQSACPVCAGHRGWVWTLERETLLLGSFGLLALLLVVTGFAARSFHTRQKDLAEEWYQKGEGALKSGYPQDAVADFRTALNYSGSDGLYQLRLAQALILVGNQDQAETYLQTLWEREPGDGIINLELARLAAGHNDIQNARRYYHNAIFGSWTYNAIQHRRDAHLELVRFLLRNGLNTEADAELISLQVNLPEDAGLYTTVGQLFMQAQDYSHALEAFRRATELDRKDRDAYLGAGEAAFRDGRYLEARSYLLRGLVGEKPGEQVALDLAVSEAVVSLDPYETRLTQRERIRRTVDAFDRSLVRLKSCAQSRGVTLPANPAQGSLQAAYAEAIKLKPSVKESKLLATPDLTTAVMDQVSTIQEASNAACGEGTAEDQALLLISRRRGTNQP